MNGLFLYFDPLHPEKPSGVEKKVGYQIAAMNDAGLNCRLVSIVEPAAKSRAARVVSAVARRLPYSNRMPKWRYLPEFDTADYIYFRKPSYITVHMRRTLREIKRRHPEMKVLMEIPTYPYDLEYAPLSKNLCFLLKDKYNRQRLQGLVDRIVMVGHPSLRSWHSVPTISIVNGINMADFPKTVPVIDGTIHLCTSANFSFRYGYERLIEPLGKYYAQGGRRNIILHMAGSGYELPYYQGLVKELKLQDRVIFHGHLGSADLQKLYARCHFGVCRLGTYRKKLTVTSELKSREFLAMGLPMIAGCPVDVLIGQKKDWYIEFPNDPSPLDIDKIIAAYDKLYASEEACEQTRSDIRTFAAATVDIRRTMSPVTQYLSLHRPADLAGGIR